LGWLISQIGTASRRFRARRMQKFAVRFGLTTETRVLDVGGTPEIWALSPVKPRVVFLNHPRARADIEGKPAIIFGDGTALPFPDRAFDIVFSNSVIEHVGGADVQARFAAEIARVARAYWVQTPARSFPVEPHLYTPFIHLLPKRWQMPLVRRFTVWAWLHRATAEDRAYFIGHCIRDVRLLSPREFAALFPGATILRERFFGLTKSLVAIKTDVAAPD
jgi:hypothetical protein